VFQADDSKEIIEFNSHIIVNECFLYIDFGSKLPAMNSEEGKGEEVWSEWLDFDQSNITTAAIPDKSGVFKVHASMKILYIGSSMNLRQALVDALSDPCVGKARRFSYLVTEKAEHVKDQFLKEYRESHGGNLPACMDK
jgi:hypothetical protein